MTGVFPNHAPLGAKVRINPQSYRHLFGQSNAQAHTPYAGHPGGPELTAKMLSKLVARMRRPVPVANMNVGWPNDDNPNIPAGYTYLAQFVAHDLVQNSGSLPPLRDFAGQLQRDYRVQRLVLDTIYGSGPGPGSLHFEPSRTGFGREQTLSVGHVRADEVHPAAEPLPLLTDRPARDIARARCPFRNDLDKSALGLIARHGTADALVADQRNDDHVIISQLTAFFHEAHNIVFRKLLHRENDAARNRIPRDRKPEQLSRIFLEARKLLAYVYRRTIVLDLLSRLLDREIYEFYTDAKRNFGGLDTDNLSDIRVPVEFSHAAFRFGHVMSRFSYVLNDELTPNPALQHLMDRSSSRRADLVPLARTWLVDWSHFFDLADGKTMNLSRRITPYLASGFLSDSLNFPNENSHLGGGLFYLDLLRGYQSGVASVDSLIGRLRPQDRERSPLLSERSLRQHEIGKWLTHQTSEFTPEELVSLSSDPPLLFFILFEAAFQHEGVRLGTLGSAILAEVFLISMKLNESGIEKEPAIPELMGAVFGEAPPTDMPALIKFVKANGGLKPVGRPEPHA